MNDNIIVVSDRRLPARTNISNGVLIKVGAPVGAKMKAIISFVLAFFYSGTL